MATIQKAIIIPFYIKRDPIYRHRLLINSLNCCWCCPCCPLPDQHIQFETANSEIYWHYITLFSNCLRTFGYKLLWKFTSSRQWSSFSSSSIHFIFCPFPQLSPFFRRFARNKFEIRLKMKIIDFNRRMRRYYIWEKTNHIQQKVSICRVQKASSKEEWNLFSLLNGRTRTCLPAGCCCPVVDSRLDGPQLPCSLSSSLQRANIPRSPIDACPLSIIISFLRRCQMGIRQVDATSGPPLFCCCCCSNVMLLQRNYHTKTE